MAHRRIFLIAVTLVLSCQSGRGGEMGAADIAAASQRAEGPKVCYCDIATLKYEGASLTGASSESWPTGFTVIRIGVPDQQPTRLAVSGSFSVDKPKEANLHVAAKDHEGNLHLPTVQSVESATGKKRRVVTLLCEFALPEKDIHDLVIQRRLLVTTVNLGIVTAWVIIDEDEEEASLLGGFEP